MSNTGMSAGEMCDTIRKEFGDNDELSYLKRGYRRFLKGQHPGMPDCIQHWSFLRPMSQLSLRASVSGTATAENDGGTVTVTATTEIFAAGDDGEYLTVDGMGTFGPLTVADAGAVATFTGTSADEFTAETVWTGSVYDLPADYGGLVGHQVYIYDSAETSRAFTLVSVEQVLEAWSVDHNDGNPYLFAIAPNTFTSTTGQRWALLCYPRPDAARVMRYPYIINPSMPTDDPACFMLGGTEHDETILSMALAVGELVTRKAPGVWAAEAQMQMIASIRRDEELFDNVSETDRIM